MAGLLVYGQSLRLESWVPFVAEFQIYELSGTDQSMTKVRIQEWSAQFRDCMVIL